MPTIAELANITIIKATCQKCGSNLGSSILGLRLKCEECGHNNEIKTTPVVGTNNKS